MSRRTAGRSRGVALLVVLWMVAALSVLVTGLVQAQRGELRQASAARARLSAGATGLAAVHLALQRITGTPQRPTVLVRTVVRVGDLDVEVEVMPLTGLVDLNLAPEPLLQALLVQAGGVDEVRASAIVKAILARREPKANAPGRPTRMEDVDELLALPGVDYDLFDKLRALMTTESAGSGRVNALAAPETVLIILARGDAELARRISQQRDAAVAGIDTTRLEAAYVDASVSSRYRLTATVPLPDGARQAVSRDVDTSPADASPAPWQTLRAGTRRMISGLSEAWVHG